MDNRELFSGKSRDYSLSRPGYPAAAAAYLRRKCHGEKVVDVGAGTGIFTACLLPLFAEVCAVEPNEDMRKAFAQFLPQVPCLNACGEATTLSNQSVDLITVAQAFHWLDEDKFKLEALRILRPGGLVAIIWNSSVETSFSIARNEVCKKYCPRVKRGYAGIRTPAEGDIFLRNVWFKSVDVVEFDNPFLMDKATFEGNMRSRSYALQPNEDNYEAFTAELQKVFADFAVDNKVCEEQKTQIYLGTLA